MTHPSLPGQPIDVPDSAVDIHRHSGWMTDDDVARAEAVQTPPATTARSTPRAAQRADTSSSKE